MEQRKKHHIQAFSLLYDIELRMKILIYERLLIKNPFQNESYSNLVTIIEQYNLLRTTPEQYQQLRKTIKIRNKVCHMKPLALKEISLLKEIHFAFFQPTHNNFRRVSINR